jgi:hypothetical protein
MGFIEAILLNGGTGFNSNRGWDAFKKGNSGKEAGLPIMLGALKKLFL